MDRALDLAEPHEHRPRPLTHPLGEICPVEHGKDLTKRPVEDVRLRWFPEARVRGTRAGVMVMIVDDDVGPGGAHAASLDLLEQQGVAVDAEATDGRCHHVRVGAGIDQRGHRHVAGNTCLAVEPGDGQLAGHRVGHVNMRAIAHAAPKPLSMPTTVTPLAHEACMASSAVTPSSPAP